MDVSKLVSDVKQLEEHGVIEVRDDGGWLAVYYTDDGPWVRGPFATEKEALQDIFADYTELYGDDAKRAQERYDNSGDEWVTRLHEGAQP